MTLEQWRARVAARRAGSPPPLARMIQTAAASGFRWAREGFAVVHPETLEARRTICQACEHWKAEAFGGRGRCLKCGCSGAKLRLPHEKCPVGKWGPEDPEPTAGRDPGAG